MTNKTDGLRDLIYFDLEKASSLLSQFKGGLPTEITESEESSDQMSGSFSANLGALKAKLGLSDAGSTSRAETKILHHDVLRRLEKFLFERGFAVDLKNEKRDVEVDGDILRKLISEVGYVRAEGKAAIEDYNRLQHFAENFEFVVDFINRCNRATVEQTDEYQEIKDEIEGQRRKIESINDRNERVKKERILESKEKKLEELLYASHGRLEKPDDWLLEGISEWIEIFNPNQIHLRLSPFPSAQNIEVVANLRPECLFDEEKRHLIFSYGSRPNINLTLLGLITSVPPKEGSPFEPTQIEDNDSLGDREQFEQAFKNMFGAINNLEAFSDFSNYPNIKVYPIAVYRKVSAHGSES